MAVSSAPVPAASAPAAPRLYFVDHLRVALTVLVVAHHAAQAYGPTGGAWPIGEDPRSRLLGFMLSVNAMFFMGVFFFLSGYFTPGTLARKGVQGFVRDRLWRLGVPCALVLALTALLRGRAEFLHLWFVIDLLVLNLIYVAWSRRRGAEGAEAVGSAAPLPGVGALCALGAWLALGTAAVRCVYPVDAWVRVAGFLPVEPAHAVQYVSLFVLGLWAAGNGWVVRFSDRLGRGALTVAALTLGAFAAYRFWPGREVVWFAGGGVSVQNLALSGLEAVVCLALGIGLLWMFRRWLPGPARWSAALAADSYGIYCVHLPVVVGLQWGLQKLPPAPLVKFVTVTLAGLLISWVITRWVLRATSLGRRIF